MSKSFEEIAQDIGQTVAKNNKQYGDSFSKAGEILRVLFPNGVAPERYVDLLAIARILDKLFRLANNHHEDTGRDIAGYGLLIEARHQASIMQQLELRESGTDEPVGPKGPIYISLKNEPQETATEAVPGGAGCPGCERGLGVFCEKCSP